MAIPAQVMRLAITGTFPSSEIWNHSYWMMPAGEGIVPDDNDGADTVLGNIVGSSVWTTYRDILKTFMKSNSAITGLHLYCYPDGGPSSPAIAERVFNTVGTSSGAAHPLQTATVASLRTGQSGRSFRGRVYLPTTDVTLDTNNQLTSAVTSAVADMVADFCGGWATEDVFGVGQAAFVCIVSPTRSARTVVTQVVVDSVMDTQRRRRNRQQAAQRVAQDVVFI